MKKYVFFDFDGTLFDTAEGVTKSVQYALSKLGIEAELNELMCFCGPPACRNVCGKIRYG